jgi:hypothetical protein
MALNLVYPTNQELMVVAQTKIPELTRNRPIFDILPIRSIDAALLMWEQKDNYTGLQQIRGLNGNPPRVKRTGLRRFIQQPGVYGEFQRIDEVEITTRRPMGVYTGPIPIDDLIMECQDLLLNRRLDRIEFIGWTLLTTGTFSVAAATGGVMHTDTFTLLTFNSAVGWGTPATATPLADFRAITLLGRGSSSAFGPGAIAYMNQITYNKLITNTNAADLGGRRTTGLSPINTTQSLNQLMTGDGLPTIQIYDQGFLNDSQVFVPWIPNDTVVVVGQRPGNQKVGEYLMTRNANNDGAAPGAYQKVFDRGEDTVPRVIEVHDGHNGGPVLYFPGAIVVMDVS